jgi:hypothetical protein
MIFAFSRLNPRTSFLNELKLNINAVIAVDHAWVAGKPAQTETGVLARRSEPDI